MSLQANDIIEALLEREGGYVDHPNDRGGPTNFGITQSTLDEVRHEIDVTDPPSFLSELPQDVKDLSKSEARFIYQRKYVLPFRFIANDSLRALVVDCGVNHGVHRAKTWLQQAVDAKPDGIIGPMTIAAVRRQSDRDTYRRLIRRRLRFYVDIATDEFDVLADAEDSDLVFLPGWIERVCEFI